MNGKRIRAITLALVTAAGLVVPVAPAPALTRAWMAPAPEERSVPGADLRIDPKPSAEMPSWTAPPPAWPGPGAASVVVGAQAGWTRAGGLPVRIDAAGGTDAAAPARVRAEVLGRADTARAGVSGLLLTLRRDDGLTRADRVSVQVDYSGFGLAFGGDWASRLRVIDLPTCHLSTVDRTACGSGKPVHSRNDVQAGRLAVELPVSAEPTLLAVAAAPSGSAGDYAATSLAASSSWSAGGSSGDFGWSYPLRTPPGLGGPEPDLALRYSSGGVDGRTASTNNQTSWIGEGWELAPGFVERRYKSCADDVSFTPKPRDLCWETDNAFVQLGGRATELVKDDTNGSWRQRDDDGSRVERRSGAGNGARDGEHWILTTVDGTQYHFGRLETSTWTVPVFGNDTGEPCHAATFAASHCVQAWRWNLDQVVDPHGNTLSYGYAKETNNYGRNLTATAGTRYDRGGYLTRIDYGQRSDSMSAPAPMRVVFGVDERCAAGATCTTGDITPETAGRWPDVPSDQICKDGQSCTNRHTPTFFSRKRLTSVTTQVLSGASYRDVDTWVLGHQFPPSGDGTAPALWLASITHTGRVGGSVSLPVVTFAGVQMENRVDALEGISAMYKWRLSDVYDESGGHIRVNYSAKDCNRSALPTPDGNTRRCFPQYWTPEGAPQPQLDWFHKYVAVQVLEDDQSGVAGIEQTDYEYLGGGAWRYDDNELTPAKYRTWSRWRGFSRVRVTRGATGGVRSQSETLYLRGMDGDRLASGIRRVTVIDSEGVSIVDHHALAGTTRESITYTGAGGAILSGAIEDPWISAPTATRGATSAHLVDIAGRRERTALAAGGWRRTNVRTIFDDKGLPTEVNDLGDTATSADDRCTRTGYARNLTAWMLDYVSREETVGVACTAAATYPGDAISDQRTFYDGGAFGAAPSRGDATRTEDVASYNGSTPVYTQVSRSTFDAYGRVLDTFDELDRRTRTAYVPATGGPLTSQSVTNPLGHLQTSTLEPAWGLPTATVDANGKRTDLTYDALGRLTAVWLPDRPKQNGVSANQTFSYLVQTSAPVVVTTRTVRDDGNYQPSYALFDGRLRPRQTQTAAPDGGRVVTDTYHDSRGLVTKANGAYWNDGIAGTTLLTVSDNAVPGQTVTVHDGAARPTAVIFLSFGTEKWRTTKSYGGDRVTVDPPDGATATTTITDADGHPTELRQYTSGTPTGGYDATSYTHTKAGNLATVTDPAGNTWRYTYDVRGRKIRQDDPDSGITTYTYDNAGQLHTTTDARGITLAHTYDALGRKTGLFDATTSGTRRAQWTYDTLASGAVVKGQPATTTRYVNGHAYTTSVNGYDNRYRPLGATVTIPTVEGALAGTYQTGTGYTDTGLPSLISYPAAGGMPAETLRYGYDPSGRLQTAQTGLSTMLTAATYSPYGEPTQYLLSATADRQLAHTYFYQDGTRLLDRTVVDRTASPTHLADVTYTYDPVGNIIRIADRPAGGTADIQCFGHDYLRRLVQAWTATDDCGGPPAAAVIGGPAPYWLSWTYDKTGNRRTETERDPATGTGITDTYTYPAPGTAHPHGLSTVASGGQATSYGHDSAGHLTRRTIGGSTRTLDWDAEGRLAGVTEAGSTTGYLYDANGNRLIRREPTATTLYLGHSELRLTASGAVSATRLYPIGSTAAVRNAGGLSFLAADHHGTASLAIDATTLAVTQRRYLPFGEPRGTRPASWPDQKGFVGGTADTTTGLTHLGAREYDATTGRFLSVDPVIDHNDPQQMNGYAYANNSPTTMTDPDGRYTDCGGGPACSSYYKERGRDGVGSTSSSHQPSRSKPPPKRSPSKSRASTNSGSGFCDGCESNGSGNHHYQQDKEKLRQYQLRQKELAARNAREQQARAARAAQVRAQRADTSVCRSIMKHADVCIGWDRYASAAGKAKRWIQERAVLSYGGCLAVCATVSKQDGHIGLTVGVGGFQPPGPSVGFATRKENRNPWSAFGVMGPVSASVGIKNFGASNQEHDLGDSQVNFSPGPKAFAYAKGVQRQVLDICMECDGTVFTWPEENGHGKYLSIDLWDIQLGQN